MFKFYFAGIISVRLTIYEKRVNRWANLTSHIYHLLRSMCSASDPYLCLMDLDPDPEGPKTCGSPTLAAECYLIEIEDVLWCRLLRAAAAATRPSELNAGNVQILRRNGGLCSFVLCSARILG